MPKGHHHSCCVLFNRRIWLARDWKHDDSAEDHWNDAANNEKLSFIKPEIKQVLQAPHEVKATVNP